MIIFLGIISAIIVISYVIDLKNNRMNTKEMVMASLIAAISFILSLIQIILFLLLAFSIPPNGLIIHIYNTRTF